ncbi:hypothetical protein Tco_0574063 [Tanacetum coccineum]
MICSIMYLTASRPDIQFSTCLCVRYQGNPKESHHIVVKRIFRYLKGTPSLGLWYPKCLSFDLKGYLDSDYARRNMDKKRTSGACQLLGGKLVCYSAKKQQSVAMSLVEAEYVVAAGCYSGEIRQGNSQKVVVLPPRAKSGHRRKYSLKHTSESYIEASKSKTGQSEKETQSCSSKDKSPSHPLPPTPVVGEMHKEAQQAAGGLTSLRATSEERAHPQLSSGTNPSVLVDQTKSTRDGLKIAQTDSGTNEESRADEISKKIKLEDLSYESEKEEEVAKYKDTHASSHGVPEDTSIPYPPSLKSAQIQELMAQVQLLQSQKNELELQKAKAEVASLKATPSYLDINQLTNLLVAELENIQWELLVELQTLLVLVSSVQKQLMTLDSLSSLLNKVTETLNRFATVVENASGAMTKDVPLAV